jgi:colanic acid biosynthesis glycosyl transferase WcaI
MPRRVIALLTKARNWSLRVAERNIVVGLRMHRYVSRLPNLHGKQKLIENWADGTTLTPQPPQWSKLRRTVAPNARFVVQYSGNLGRAHDYQTLLGAALELRDESDWLFLFTGGGANMRRLQQEAERHRLQNLRFEPYQPRERLADSLAAADVHISSLLPRLEGLIVPSKLYGILAAGRPVIVIGDPDGEQARVVRGAGCGGVIAHGDSAGLVNELRRMRSDPEWMRDAAAKARHLFEDRYTIAIAVRKWRAILASAATAGTVDAVSAR